MINNGYEELSLGGHILVSVHENTPGQYWKETTIVHGRRWRGGKVTHYQIGEPTRGLEWIAIEHLMRHDDGK